ncbi:MAG TPA: HAMP domain-containing sensor histidine kinase [Cyclobacteriaceae bacterium]
MKRSGKIKKKALQVYNDLLKKLYTMFVFFAAVLPAEAQVKHLIQVKTFDEQLQPMNNVDVSINDRDYISTGNKGTVFTELSEHELPIKTIKIKNQQFEAAAWNYSKSILEIVVRKKNYHLAQVTVKNPDEVPLANLTVTFEGKKTTTATTNAEGKLEIPLALEEKIGSASQFAVSGHEVIDLLLSDHENVLTVERIRPAPFHEEVPVESNKTDLNNPVTQEKYFKDFTLSKLDSIQSLTVFYAIFKNFAIKDLSEEVKRKVDSKFNELVAQLQDSIRNNEDVFMGRISDSSFVNEDIKNLLNQAATENRTLKIQRTDFDEKMKIISTKLERGIVNLDAATRATLLSDLIALEKLLTENESRFYKNMGDYRQIINALKERYFDFQYLEDKLSESEARRLEEQRTFRQRLIGISVVVIAFAVLTILLFSFSNRLRKQKKDLMLANAEVKRVNENLEAIVKNRTRLLQEANRELDTFLYRASHDLRSPLCSIIGLCNIAIHLSEGEPKELVQRVAHTTNGMDKLLKKLSIISEINQPTGYSSITLLDIAENIRQKFNDVIRDENIEFDIDCPADLVFYSYPNLVEAVLTNLIENALFYSVMRDPRNACVELKASIKNDRIELCVRDNGIGVDYAIRHRLFDMFFKGHEDSKGNGLGLYIVQKSVQTLEGNVTVESEQGHYSQFVVQLPLNTIPLEEKLVGALA